MRHFPLCGDSPSATRNHLRIFTAFALLGAVGIAVLFSGGSAPALAQTPQGAQGRPEMVDVLIGFTRAPGAQEEQLIRGQNGQVRRNFTLVPAVAATVPETAINVLLNDRRVSVIEPDGEFHAIEHDPPIVDDDAAAAELSNTWGVERIGAGLVHLGDETLELPANLGAGVGLAVFDTGLDYNHPEFHWNYVGGNDFHNGDSDPMDDNGHGTHVSGTAAAARDGIEVVGAAPEVHLYALKMLGADGGGSFSSVIAALEWCVDHNQTEGNVPILVTNHSYGSGMHPGSIVEQAFDNAYATGILHVAAAGNSGNKGGNNDTVGYPAAFGSVIAVAATDQNDKRPSWSSTGPAVELSAPGVAIYSSQLGGGYHTLSGTSMASPHVAGVAALAWSSSFENIDGPLNNSGVRDVLASTALDLGNANHYGYGLVDAWAAAVMASGGSSDDSGTEPTPEEGVLTVASIDYAEHRNGRHLFIDVGVVDAGGVGVSDATVEIDVYLDGGLYDSLGGTTGADGTVSFRLSSAPSGFYSSVVVGAFKEGWGWDGATPENGYEKQ